MIKYSKGMVPCVFKSYLLEPGYNKIFSVYGNSVAPTQEQIQSLYDTNEGSESFTLGVNQVDNIDPAAQLRTELILDSSMVASQLATNFFRFETSQRSEEFINHSVGDASWFLFAITEGTSTANNAETPLMFIGSVGDPEDDTADIRIIDNEVGNSINYLLNDLEISYRV